MAEAAAHPNTDLSSEGDAGAAAQLNADAAAGPHNGDTDSDVELGSSSQQVRDQLEEVSSRHKHRGDAAFQRQEWDLAVKEYTSGLKCTQSGSSRQLEADLLVRRSSALIKFAQHLLSIPARVSERRAVFAHDPLVLSQLALKDAQRAGKLKPQCAEVYACEGRALLLLEKHLDAESAFLEGLALQPTHKTLKEDLQRVQEILALQDQEQQQLLADVRKASVDGGSSGGGVEAVAARDAAAAAAAGGGGSNAAAAAAAAAGGGGGGIGGGSSSSPARRARSISLEGGGSGIHGGARAGGVAGVGVGPKRQRRLVAVPDADDADCILCMKLLFEPVTTPCGHTFCKGCFARSMDHGNRCPMCRTVLHVGRELPVTVTLQSIISKAFPDEYNSRAQEAAAAAAAAAAADADAAAASASRVTLPLFVMSTLVPGEKMALNIFEPRYRLMVRRCMEGNRRFGMAQTGRTGPDGLDELACEAEIMECSPLPDGRYYLELIGRRRIKITQSWELDGYRVAAAEVVRDEAVAVVPPPPAAAAGGNRQQQQQQQQEDGAGGGAAAAADGGGPEGGSSSAAGEEGGSGGSAAGGSNGGVVDASALASDVLACGDELMAKMRNMLSTRRMAAGHIRELFDRLGDKPAASNPEAVSWWASRLLLLLLPSNTEHWMRRELLAETSTVARLQKLQQQLGALARAEVVGGQSCAIM